MLSFVLAGLIQQDPMVLVIRPVVPGVHVISGLANGNILAVEGADQVLVVDAQSGKRIGLADSALRAVTRKSVRQVAFTHYHKDRGGGLHSEPGGRPDQHRAATGTSSTVPPWWSTAACW